jgi:hypothetical protein
MGKRSDFQRIERDYYPTPIEAVRPLVPHLPRAPFNYTEPCAGDGRLVLHLRDLTGGRSLCEYSCDTEPQSLYIKQADALDIQEASMFITNPPWDRKVLHPLIEHLSSIAPTWLLFDADWMHTKQSRPMIQRLKKVVSVGRVRWIEGTNMTGKDNCCWHLFDARDEGQSAQFFGRL